MTDGGGQEPKLDSLRSVAHGASLFVIGKLVRDGLKFVTHIILSRYLGAGVYGVFAYCNMISKVGLALSNVGSDKSLLRYVPQYSDDPQRQRFTVGLAWMTSILGGGTVATVLFLGAPTIASVTISSSTFVSLLRLFAAIVLLDTLAKLLYSTFRALELMEYEVLTSKLLRPTIRLIAVGGAIVAGASIYGIVVALVGASLLVLGLAFLIFLRTTDLRPSLRIDRDSGTEIKKYYNYSLPLSAQQAGQILQSRVDILLVGVFLSSTAVGIYNASYLVAAILLIPLAGFNQLFPPVASRLYSNGDIEELSSVYSTVTRWIFTITFFMALVAIIFRIEILLLFGEEFTAGSAVFALLIVGHSFNGAAGSNGYLLMMTDHQYVVMCNQWIFGAVNVVLTYLFILEFGLAGAALASAGVLALVNVTKIAEVWYLEGLFPYDLSFARPIVCGGIAVIGMYPIKVHLSGIAALVIGGAVGTVIYSVVIWNFGVAETDKKILVETIREGL